VTNKRVIKLPIESIQNEVQTFIPLGIVVGQQPGPTLAVIAGVHASEYAAREGAVRFWQSLNPTELSGRVLVVLAADVTAFCAHHIYTNPVDGKNLNRIYPGKADGSLTEVIAYTLMTEVIAEADAIIDCHGGEFDEYMGLYTIVPATGQPELDQKTKGLAFALGLPFIELTEASGSWLGRGTLQAEAVRLGRPAMAIEAGERGRQDERAIGATFNALQNAMKHYGMIPGQPVPWAGQPVWLERGLIVRSTAGGVFERQVMTGDWVEPGQVFGRVLDFDGTVLEEIRAEAAGVVLTVICAPAIKAEGFAGKIGVIKHEEFSHAV
jgi:predicted deacylase